MNVTKPRACGTTVFLFFMVNTMDLNPKFEKLRHIRDIYKSRRVRQHAYARSILG